LLGPRSSRKDTCIEGGSLPSHRTEVSGPRAGLWIAEGPIFDRTHDASMAESFATAPVCIDVCLTITDDFHGGTAAASEPLRLR